MAADDTMTEDALRLGVREVERDVSVIDIDGDVTPAAEDGLSETFEQLKDAESVIFNFGGLDYMNSGGIGLLVTLLVRAQRRGQQLVAYGLSDHYRQIFELTQLDDAIRIEDDESAAVAATKGG